MPAQQPGASPPPSASHRPPGPAAGTPAGRHGRRNLMGYALAEVFWGFAWALSLDAPMLSAFADHVGASDDFLGLVWLVIGVCLAAPMVLAGWLSHRLRHKRSVVFWGHMVGAALMMLLSAALHATADMPDVRLVVYVVGVGLFFLSMGYLIPPWLSLVGDLFEPRLRTRVLGVTFVFNRVGGFFGGALARDALRDTADPWVLLFLVSGVLMCIGSFAYFLIVEPPRPTPSPRPRLGAYLRAMLGSVRDNRPLRRFIAADLLGVSFFVLLAYFSKAGFDVGGMDRSTAGTWTQLGAVGLLSASLLLAWKGHALLPRTWIASSLFVGAAGAGLVAWGGAPWVYGVAAVVTGWCIGTRMACHAPEVLRLCHGDGTTAVGIAGALATTTQGLLPFAAGYALLVVPYRGVFLVTGLLTALGGVLMLCGSGARDAAPSSS